MQNVSWIPIDTAAQFVVDARSTSNSFLHLLHPRPVSWNVIANAISSALDVSLVPYHEWLARLEANAFENQEDEMSVRDRLPALKLLPFFRSVKWSQGMEAMGLPQIDMARALEASDVLDAKCLAQISQEHVRGWLDGWKQRGFLL
jgi:hypothetical protein